LDDTNDTAVHLASSEQFEKREQREDAFKELQEVLHSINDNEGLHLIEHLLLRPRLDEVMDEEGKPFTVLFPDVCLDLCDLGKGLNEGEIPLYRKKVHRIPADKCYDKMPWVLEYFKFNDTKKKYDISMLFMETYPSVKEPVPLKFRHYDALAQRVRDLQEFGSERINYRIEFSSENKKSRFRIIGAAGRTLAVSAYAFNERTGANAVPEDIEIEIQQLMRYLEYQLDLYCKANPCDNDEDPFSFRTTIVLPCWPKRLRDKTFRNLVEKTIEAETPAHIHTKVVWLGISEMRKFEQAYFAWLQEMAQTEMPAYEIINPFIDTINRLVPCGTCKEDCRTE
jgi:hypothetical protein